MRKIFFLLLLALIATKANSLRIEYGRTVVISQPVFEDLYIAGGNITVNAPVYGDLIIAGGEVSINDSVLNDLLVAGGTVFIQGFIQDDIRCAGGELHILTNTGGDLIVTGGRVDLNKASSIAGSLMASGGTVTVNGRVSGEARVYSGQFYFNGIAEKNLEARGGIIDLNGEVFGSSIFAARKIHVGNAASFHNDIRYWNKSRKLNISSPGVKAVYDPELALRTEHWYYLGFSGFLGFLWYAGMALLLIALTEFFFTRTMRNAGESFYTSPGRGLGYGLAFVFGVPILAVLCFVTLIGIPVGIMLLLSYIAILLMAGVISSVVVANWINNRFQYNMGYWKLVFSAFGIFIVLKILTFTPFIGWLLMMLIACIAFGSILLNIDWRTKLRRPAVVS